MSKMRSLLAVAALAAAAGTASAAVETWNQAWAFPLSPNDATLVFPKFDTLGGTRVLTKVEMLTNSTMTANVTAENDSVIPAPGFGVNLSGFVTVAFGSLNGFNALSQGASAGVAATDGISGSGPDFHDFGALADSGSGATDTTSGLAAFIAPGTISAFVHGEGGFSVTGSTNSSNNVSNFMGSGDVTINYYWEAVPAPASLALLGMGGLVIGRRRR